MGLLILLILGGAVGGLSSVLCGAIGQQAAWLSGAVGIVGGFTGGLLIAPHVGGASMISRPTDAIPILCSLVGAFALSVVFASFWQRGQSPGS
jgi:uncharacterized membrane protein YeaQ/YmgE (transglycosylase-associated protein family)